VKRNPPSTHLERTVGFALLYPPYGPLNSSGRPTNAHPGQTLHARLPLLAVRHLFTEEISGIADLNWLCRQRARILFFEALFISELKVNYLEFLLLGAASTGIGLRCYFLMKRENALLAAEQSSSGRRRSAREKRAQEATLARRLFRYHSGLTHA
jgi:hypothetical protein